MSYRTYLSSREARRARALWLENIHNTTLCVGSNAPLELPAPRESNRDTRYFPFEIARRRENPLRDKFVCACACVLGHKSPPPPPHHSPVEPSVGSPRRVRRCFDARGVVQSRPRCHRPGHAAAFTSWYSPSPSGPFLSFCCLCFPNAH